MTDDDLAWMLAVSWDMDPDAPGVLDAMKSTTQYATLRLRFAVDDASVRLDRALAEVPPPFRWLAVAAAAVTRPVGTARFVLARRRCR